VIAESKVFCGLLACFGAAAFANPSLEDVERKIGALGAPATTVLYEGARNLFEACAPIGIGPFKRCTVPVSVSFSAGAPLGGIDALHLASAGTRVVVHASVKSTGAAATLMVNSNACELSDGVTSCDVPVASGHDLLVSIAPKYPGTSHLPKDAQLVVTRVELHRGFEAALKSLRADAEATVAAIESDKPHFEKLTEHLRIARSSKDDLERLFRQYALDREFPLPAYDTPLLDAQGNVRLDVDGFELRDRVCPLQAGTRDDGAPLWSHSVEECATLGVVADLLQGKSVFVPADLEAVRARLVSRGELLARIVAALETSRSVVDARFEELLVSLRAQGLVAP
jgi:hypothetical protein